MRPWRVSVSEQALGNEDLDTVAALALSHIERFIGLLHQSVDVITGGTRRGGNPKTTGDVEDAFRNLNGGGRDGGTNVAGAGGGAVQIAVRHDDDEFFPAITAGSIVRADASGNAFGGFPQNGIPGGVSEAIVDL